MKKIIRKFIEKTDNGLHRKCDGLPPERRRIIVIVSLIAFAMMAVYMAVGSVLFMDHSHEMPDMEHIKKLDLPKPQNESINPLKFNEDDDDE